VDRDDPVARRLRTMLLRARANRERAGSRLAFGTRRGALIKLLRSNLPLAGAAREGRLEETKAPPEA